MLIQLYKLFTTVIDLAITTEDEVTNPLTSHNCGTGDFTIESKVGFV